MRSLVVCFLRVVLLAWVLRVGDLCWFVLLLFEWLITYALIVLMCYVTCGCLCLVCVVIWFDCVLLLGCFFNCFVCGW